MSCTHVFIYLGEISRNENFWDIRDKVRAPAILFSPMTTILPFHQPDCCGLYQEYAPRASPASGQAHGRWMVGSSSCPALRRWGLVRRSLGNDLEGCTPLPPPPPPTSLFTSSSSPLSPSATLLLPWSRPTQITLSSSKSWSQGSTSELWKQRRRSAVQGTVSIFQGGHSSTHVTAACTGTELAPVMESDVLCAS